MIDKSPYDAMNRGIMAARGEWIWFLNSGDMASPSIEPKEVLELLSSLTDKAIWIIFNSMTVDEGGREIRRSLATDYSKKNLLHGEYTCCHQAVITRRLTLAKHGGFSPAYEIAADYEMYIRCSLEAHPVLVGGTLVHNLDGGIHTKRFARLLMDSLRARWTLTEPTVCFACFDAARTARRMIRATVGRYR